MKKLCILLVLLLCVPVFPIVAQQENEKLLFFDDFETENIESWELIEGEPVFVCEENNHAYSVTNQDYFEKETMSGMRNYSYSFRMKIDYRDSDGNFGNTWPTLRFRVSENAYYNMYLYNEVGSEEIGVQKFIEGEEYWLATASPALTEDNEKWVSVKIEMLGNEVNIYYDDLKKPLISFVDSEGITPVGGSFCFIENGVSAFYLDDLRVEKTYAQVNESEKIEKSAKRELIHFYDYETQAEEKIEEQNGNHYINAMEEIRSAKCNDFICYFNWKRNYYPYGEENPSFEFGEGYAFELDSTLSDSAVVLKKDGNELVREKICFADFDDVWTIIGFSVVGNRIEFYFNDMEVAVLSYEAAEILQGGEISLCGGYVDNWYLASAYRFKPIEIVSSETDTEEGVLSWKIRTISHEESNRSGTAIAVGYLDGKLCAKSVLQTEFIGNDCNAVEKKETQITFTLPQIEGAQYSCFLWDGMSPLSDGVVLGEEVQRISMPPKTDQSAELVLEAVCDGKCFQISGKINENTQSITLLLQGVDNTEGAEQGPNPSDAVYHTQLSQVEADGTFTAMVKIDEEMQEGDYRIFAGSDDCNVVWTDVEFLKPSNVSAFLQKINDAEDAESVRGLLLDEANMRYARRLGLRPHLFIELAQENLQLGVISRMLAQKGEGFTEENIEDVFVPHLAFALLKVANDGEQIHKILQDNENMYSLPVLYANMTEKVQTEALNGLCAGLKAGKYDSVEKALEDIEPNLILASVYLTNYKDMLLLLEQYQSELGIDLKKLSNLTPSEKTDACRKMNSERSYTYEDFQTFYENVIDEVKQTPKPTRKPSSSGGGGGTKITVEPTLTPMPMQTPVPQRLPVYQDVPNNHWAQMAIEYLSEPQRAIIGGYEDGNFYPDKKITRAEFVKLIVNAFYFEGNGKERVFFDVSQTEWYAPYIQKAAQNGIVEGSEGFFEPQKEITRQDMAAILYRVTQKKLIPLEELCESDFYDSADISPYAQKAVVSLAAAGIISGMENHTYCPRTFATRAQAAKIIYEMIK